MIVLALDGEGGCRLLRGEDGNNGGDLGVFEGEGDFGARYLESLVDKAAYRTGLAR